MTDERQRLEAQRDYVMALQASLARDIQVLSERIGALSALDAGDTLATPAVRPNGHDTEHEGAPV